LLDQTGLFTRKQWASFLGVSEAAISQWLHDKTLPRHEILRLIVGVLSESDGVPSDVLNHFWDVATRPASEVTAHAERVGRTAADYILEPVFDGFMRSFRTLEAAQRVLKPEATGNGVTGFVAACGKSYVCPDTSTDPLYIEGAQGARSSLTVPLIYEDQVIGTFNVESPQLGAFGEEDLQFAEIFSREIATALHTLELLSAQKRCTRSQSVETISREVALPAE
jgi:GAF domain-containing protein